MFNSSVAKLLSLALIYIVLSSSVSAQQLLIRNTNIIDTANAETQPNRDVLIEGNRIQRISDVGSHDVPESTVILDATGKFLIPGLWDMHVHTYDTDYLPLFIANGVTGTRQMLGRDIHYDWRREEFSEDFIGPKTIIASPLIDGFPSSQQSSIIVTDEEKARALVREYHEKGADFIKVYSNLDREIYFAIVDESNKLNIPFSGHVPNSVLFLEAAEAGQATIEHMTLIDLVTSDTYARVVESYRDIELNPQNGIEYQQKIYEGHGGREASELFEVLISNQTWITPTLTAHRSVIFMDERIEIEAEERSYLPFDNYASWNLQANQYRQNRSAEAVTMLERQYESYLSLVGDLHRAGVNILAGSDSGEIIRVAGFCLHDELQLLVEAGLSPGSALKAATINAAEASGKLQDFGAVEEGKLADLVLLQANPLDDIRNTETISAVILNGVLYDRDALDELLDEVKRLPANYR